MSRQSLFILFLLGVLGLATACGGARITATPTPAPGANLPNPASVYCEQNGGKLEMRQDSSGGTAGICKFPDGSECDEWAYFRGECKSGAARAAAQLTETLTPTGPAPTALPEVSADGWKIYRNNELGYIFHYPSDTTISSADDPQHTLTVAGPQSGGGWPTIFVNHPTDREDYRPPAGVDLEKWLKDHNLLMTDGKLGEVRQADTQIAGVKAIHTRLARSPQTYAYDKYYFAHSQQLYSVVILHVGDKEDWTLYNHFLSSIQFE